MLENSSFPALPLMEFSFLGNFKYLKTCFPVSPAQMSYTLPSSEFITAFLPPSFHLFTHPSYSYLSIHKTHPEDTKDLFEWLGQQRLQEADV